MVKFGGVEKVLWQLVNITQYTGPLQFNYIQKLVLKCLSLNVSDIFFNILMARPKVHDIFQMLIRPFPAPVAIYSSCHTLYIVYIYIDCTSYI